MSQTLENANELITDLYALLSLKDEELSELREREKVLKAQVQALMKGQRVDYKVG